MDLGRASVFVIYKWKLFSFKHLQLVKILSLWGDNY